MTNTQGYSAELLILGKKFKGKGKTIPEAIASLKPDIIKAKGILTISKGKKSRERILAGVIVMRAFGPGSPFMKEVAIKQVAQLFDEGMFT